MEVVVDGRLTFRILVWAGVVVTVVGLGAVLVRTVLGRTLREAVWLLDPMGDSTIPTWYAALILLVASLLLVLCAVVARTSGGGNALWWAGLSVIFLGMSIDEVARIHEWSAPAVEGDGLLYYSWVLVGIPVVVVIAASYMPFLLRLPAHLRNGLLLAGAVFVGGALGVEMLNASLDAAAGSDTLAYGIGTTIEEAMEVAGVLLLIHVLLTHLRDAGLVVRLDLFEASGGQGDDDDLAPTTMVNPRVQSERAG